MKAIRRPRKTAGIINGLPWDKVIKTARNVGVVASVFILSALSAPIKNPDQYSIREAWQRYLIAACAEKELDYPILSAQARHESKGNPFDVERKNGKKISFGLFQISIETAQDYFMATGTRPPADVGRWLLNYRHNVDVHTWQTRRALNRTRSYLKTLSEHNLGYDGYRKYARTWRGKTKCYGPYIVLVEKKLGYKIDN